MSLAQRIAAVLPAALLLILSFLSGGYFPDAVGLGAAALLALLAVWATTVPDPLAGTSRGLIVAVAALAAFAAWSLVSGTWSDAAGRAVLEYQRALLYVAVMVGVGALGRADGSVRVLVRSLGAAAAAVVVAALAVWLLPVVFPAPAFDRDRLSWPTSYWNATGLLAGFALIWNAHLTADARERRPGRVLSAGVVPLAAAVIVFSSSRGAAAATAAGLVVFLVSSRARILPIALLAVVPPTAVAVVLAGRTEGLAVDAPSVAALDAGRETVVLLALCALAAVAVRAACLPLDRRMARAPLARPGRALKRAAVALGVLLVVGLGSQLDLPERLGNAVDGFTSAQAVPATRTPGERFLQIGNNGRIDHWRVALEGGFSPHPVLGTGAGTYEVLWERDRTGTSNVLDGHSLYVEVLGELGLIGLVLLLVALGACLGGITARLRGAERQAWAAVLGASAALLVHAGVDWDWEMPALTAWFFAAGGLALAAPRRGTVAVDGRSTRIVAALLCLGLAITPVLAWRSQVEVVDAIEAVRVGRCDVARPAALAAARALSSRAEPYELLAYCQAAAGRAALARRSIRAAIARDPHSWEPRYGEALVLAATGGDPRPSLREALRRNPLDPRPLGLMRQVRQTQRAGWRRLALRTPLPLPAGRP